jgi:hypothetical protein
MGDLRVIVIHQFPHARGTLVAGLEGRTYQVATDNGALHLATGDQVDPVPGCCQADADRFLQFRSFRRAVPPPPPSPLSAPPVVNDPVVDCQEPEAASTLPQTPEVEAAVPPSGAKRRRRNP